jgi:hypothetical protein
MSAEKPIFCQIMDWVHGEQFRRCVNRYRGNYRIRSFSCWDQFLAMSFAQVTYRDSLADIEVCLRSRQDQLYRLGFRSAIAHSTLADANSSRDWRIYHDLQGLIARARRLYASESFGLELEQTVYALDSTTIDLCLSLFPWARFRSTKAAVKLHTLLDVRGPIPTMISISEGKRADVKIPTPVRIYASFVLGVSGFTAVSQIIRLDPQLCGGRSQQLPELCSAANRSRNCIRSPT